MNQEDGATTAPKQSGRLKKPNFTAIPNELFDIELATLSGAKLKVLLAIFRSTVGWHRDTHPISLNQMAEMTGMSRSTCAEALKELESGKYIRKYATLTEEGASGSAVYEPLFYDDLVAGGCTENRTTPCTENRTRGCTENRYPYKEEIKEAEIKEIHTPLTPSENTPQKLIDYTHFTPKQKPFVRNEANWTDAMRYSMSLAEAAIEMKRRLSAAGLSGGLRSHPSSRETSKPLMRAFEALLPNWREDPDYVDFTDRYDGTGYIATVTDKEKGYRFWCELSLLERELAKDRVVGEQGAWVKRLDNYLHEKEFTRPPRPAAKTKAQIALERA